MVEAFLAKIEDAVEAYGSPNAHRLPMIRHWVEPLR
jgi:hypothetical protein